MAELPNSVRKILLRLDLPKAHLENFPGFVFLCGGSVAEPHAPPGSVRDVVLRQLKSDHTNVAERVVLAEQINNWSLDAVFNDLYTLEEHLAALASVVVVIVESPGSIAELGVFTALTHTSEKLLVFVQSPRDRDDSFIALGPLRRQKLNREGSVSPYVWTTVKVPGQEIADITSIGRCAVEMAEEIVVASTSRVPRVFNSGEFRDQMLLICDLVDHLIALKLGEIRESLEMLGIIIDLHQLRRFLFILEKLGLLRAVNWGYRHTYYVAARSTRYFRLQNRAEEPPYDRERIQTEIATLYRMHDPSRHRAIADKLSVD